MENPNGSSVIHEVLKGNPDVVGKEGKAGGNTRVALASMQILRISDFSPPGLSILMPLIKPWMGHTSRAYSCFSSDKPIFIFRFDPFEKLTRVSEK